METENALPNITPLNSYQDFTVAIQIVNDPNCQKGVHCHAWNATTSLTIAQNVPTR